MRFFLLCLAVFGSLGALVVAAGIAVAHQFRKGALDLRTGPDPLDLEVTAVSDGRITLRRTRATRSGDWSMPGTFGLAGEHGYHRVGDVIELRAGEAVREHLGGRGVFVPGDMARVDSFAFEGDPEVAHGLGFETVGVESPLGAMPAWFVPGSAETWVLLVHGKGANRREALRVLPTLVEMGLPCLLVTYRNDEEAPNSEDARYAYGRHEWEDLEAATRYALDRGAMEIVLMGFSMGGAIALSFLEKSPLSRSVVGVILDAPMLDLRQTVAHGATKAGVPLRILPYTNRVASRRYGVDWEEVDYLKRAGSLTPPILLFHGDADGMVPVNTSDRLAEALPKLVTYIRIPGAGHVHGWNVDRERYTAAVRTFLTKVLSDARTVRATV
ncbi:MAG: alpha/beta fold hydrolase [Anaerolineaceae bacterium]